MTEKSVVGQKNVVFWISLFYAGSFLVDFLLFIPHFLFRWLQTLNAAQIVKALQLPFAIICQLFVPLLDALRPRR